ncbi:hypothetical protein KIL84_001491 [Mauremys mutica]|uniref:Uncharacterized protein n=1 Tax=Mauremys mutica TaxID=74926 RepID=A0A9D4AVS3_9SAUR|nr:hypothetical protein KIL84_001491 [Mauremys mutica]
MLAGAADPEQENQENVPPVGKARPPAAARPVLALLRGNQRRPTQQQARRALHDGAAGRGRYGPGLWGWLCPRRPYRF